jgi:dTMP kinase
VGSLIRQILQQRLVTLAPSGPRKPSWDTMGLMFAADRLDHLENEIEPNLMDGIHVVSDRYVHSSIVYQSVTAGSEEARDWLTQVNSHARRPDVVFYLEVHPEEALKRRLQRQSMLEMYEDPEMQIRLAAGYDEILSNLTDTPVSHIDGSASTDEVHAACMKKLRELGIP